MTLEPGDVISTGTPPGVGLGQKPPRYLEVGGTVRLGIAGLGEQRQVVKAHSHVRRQIIFHCPHFPAALNSSKSAHDTQR
jgi:hypothetical protein